MMRVSIDSLKIKAILGILPFEREKKQKLIIDIKFKYNYSDSTKEYVDYAEVVKFVKKDLKRSKYYLIEEAIESLVEKLTSKFLIQDLKISIKKPTIMKNCIVGVSNCN